MGRIDEGLLDLTGGLGERLDMESAEMCGELAELFARLFVLHDRGYMLGAASRGTGGGGSIIVNHGIVQGHAYTILRAVEVDGLQMVRLRNTWGRTEWEGRFSDGDAASWTPRLRAKLGYVNADDGAFWMTCDDLGRHFQYIYVCRVLRDAEWCSARYAGRWSKADGTAPSCASEFFQNPQLRLTLETAAAEPADVLLVLSQRDAVIPGLDIGQG